MTTSVTARSSLLPVSLEEAKQHLRVTGEEQETYIDSLLHAATEYVESATGRSFRVSETVTQSYSEWPSCFQFDREPVSAIESIEYYSDGVLVEVDAENYRLVKSRNAAATLEWDANFSRPTHDARADAIVITYTAGYETIDGELGVPALAKHAVKMKLSEMFGLLNEREMEVNAERLADIIAQLDWGSYR